MVLNDNKDLMFRYYESVLRYRHPYREDEHYYRLLAVAFDRPALRTPFDMENRVTDFISALAATRRHA